MERELAVVLHDLAWLLPRTIGAEPSPADVLPPSELEVMRLLVRRPRVSVNDAARELGLHAANVSTAIRTLEARGLLRRERDGDDRRVVRLRPTARALRHRERQEQAWGDALEHALAALAPRDARRLRACAPALAALATELGRRRRGPMAQPTETSPDS
jgi:DNA-binding MarR family transcriptional regulator